MFAQSKGGNYSLTDGASGVADAIDFDGATDYLSRSTDLVGNADGKTFTFSIFGWRNATGPLHTIYDNGKITIQINASDQVIITGKNAAGTTILSATTTAPTVQKQTFDSLLISIDLANTANRSIYIGDAAATVTWTTYTNDALDWTAATHAVGAVYSGAASKYTGRLSSLFLDYTYRNLSIEANRRLFITADRKPAANQSALNPILYLPLNDPTQPGKNLGTGGDFALNGVVARSGRGPSQFNAPYSDLDGAADYLSRTSLTGLTDGKAFTLAFCLNADAVNGLYPLEFSTSVGYRFHVYFPSATACRIVGRNTSNAIVLQADFPASTFALNRNYHVVASIDLASASNRGVYVNGTPVSMIWTTYTNSNIGWASDAPLSLNIGRNASSTYWDGRLGNVFFDTRYIDLSQPANLAKFVTGTGIDAKPADLGANGEKPFGTPPLIYLPMYGNNAGKNYGTGGDFTVNSGPFPGARGPNEFWGNKADFDGATGRLNRNSQLASVSDKNIFSFSFWIYKDVTATAHVILSSTDGRFNIRINGSDQLLISAKNPALSTILTATMTTTISNNTQHHLCGYVDLSNTVNRGIYFNGSIAAVTWSTYINDLVDFTTTDTVIGSQYDSAGFFNGKLSELYLTTDYIDFSQEANRLKFRDAFGNPVDLAPQIAAGTLPNPAIYMRFDPANFGKNSGTGGDFVVNGTITDGSQL